MTALKTLDEELLSGLAPGIWAAISSELAAARENGEDKPFLVRVKMDFDLPNRFFYIEDLTSPSEFPAEDADQPARSS